MSRKGWVLFAAMSVIWGIPYLLIRVAVDELSPPLVVLARTGVAAAVLVPLAALRGALRPAVARWRPVVAFAVIEMAGPWLLLTDAERRLPSSTAGLLVAVVPLIAVGVAVALGDRTVLAPARLAGLVIGMAGVAVVAGVGRAGEGDVWAVVEVLLVALGYASAPFIADRRLADVPSLGVIAVSLGLVAVVYLPIAASSWPSETPTADALWALTGLAVICTGIAFVVFFALIAEVGPDRATLITFVNPAVAVALGVIVLEEALTSGLVVGGVLVVLGCWLASRGPIAVPEPVLPPAAPV